MAKLCQYLTSSDYEAPTDPAGALLGKCRAYIFTTNNTRATHRNVVPGTSCDWAAFRWVEISSAPWAHPVGYYPHIGFEHQTGTLMMKIHAGVAWILQPPANVSKTEGILAPMLGCDLPLVLLILDTNPSSLDKANNIKYTAIGSKSLIILT